MRPKARTTRIRFLTVTPILSGTEEMSIADAGAYVVVDEALAFPPTRIALSLGGHSNFIGIYTPHKSICINGMKCSLVAFHPTLEDFFDDWADVLSGGLSVSACLA